jgi:type IV pilus assembly protein PilE
MKSITATFKREAVQAHTQRGFSLVEMVIGMLVALLLATVAYPSFSNMLYSVRRADAITSLALLQMAQERWRADQNTYGELAELGVSNLSPSKYYELSVTARDADGFEAQAQAKGGQAGDQSCRFFKITVTDGVATRTSGPDAKANNTAEINRRCWMSS